MKTKQEVAKLIADEIEFDIDDGIYTTFDSLRCRLKHIVTKLRKIQNIINADDLSDGEMKTLEDNDYWYFP